jgi:hypothetical protein
MSIQPDPDMARISEALRQPMAHKTYTVPAKGTRKARTYAYIDARDVENRLDEVVGMENWSDTYEPFGKDAVQCHLTVLGVLKSGIGYPNSARDDEEEPLKAAESDALKRAAVKFGIGRFLYSLKVGTSVEAQSQETQSQETQGRTREQQTRVQDPAPQQNAARTPRENPVSQVQVFRTEPDAAKDPQVERIREQLRELAHAEQSSPLALMTAYIGERGWKVAPQGLATWPAKFKEDFEKEIAKRLKKLEVTA